MINKTIAIIPARAGSKGIPSKNIQLLLGKPLLNWTIEAALKAKSLDRVIVSTDSEEIATIAHSAGAEVPFLRPSSLATDTANSMDVLIHACEWLSENESYHAEIVMLLQPTSPFRQARDIDAALGLLEKQSANAVISVCSAETHPALTKKQLADGTLVGYVPSEGESLRRQDLEPAYAVNGAIYAYRREILFEHRYYQPPGTFGYSMPAERSWDIDTPWDLRIAQYIARELDDNNSD